MSKLNKGITVGSICWYSKYQSFGRATQRDIDTCWEREDYEFRLATADEAAKFIQDEIIQRNKKQQNVLVPESWTTFSGKKVKLNEVDHQHLSNLYWFMQIFQHYKPEDLTDITTELSERFNGQLLPYRPHLNFKMEIEGLIKLGMLKKHISVKKNGFFSYVIVMNHVIIGEIISPVKIQLKK